LVSFLPSILTAIKICDAALKEHPQMTELWLAKAALCNRGPGGAETILAAALNVAPQEVQLYLALASLHLKKVWY
jgi:hypothetical protein